MPIRTPARGTTSQAPAFRFSANFDLATEQGLKDAAAERSKHARQATDRGIVRADEFARTLAQAAAAMLQGAYAEAGYSIPVAYRKNGRFYTIAVDSKDPRDQKWARMLEDGYGPRDLRDTLPTARRKRAVKITRTRMTKEGPKEYRRGGKEAEPGWYIVVPIVRGQIRRSGSKITFQRRLNGGMTEGGAAAGKQNAAELAELAGRLKGSGVTLNHNYETTTYRTGPGLLGPAMTKGMLTTTQAEYESVSPEQRRLAAGDGPSRNITLAVGGKLQIKPNKKFGREMGAYNAAQAAVEHDEQRKTILAGMGVPDAVVRSLEPAPAWMLEQANAGGSLGELANVAIKKHAQYKGQVVSFRRLSTRDGKSGKGFIVPGRAGKHFMAEAMGWMKRELQQEINRQSSRGRLTIEQEAYVNMLRSMAN